MQAVSPSNPDQSESGEKDCMDALLQRKFEELFQKHPELPKSQAFFLEACQMHVSCLELEQQIASSRREIAALQRMLRLESSSEHNGKTSRKSENADLNESEHRKRQRRVAVEIARHYVCSVEGCNKSYGSEGSLNQHMKLKHSHHYTRHLLMLDLAQPH